MPRRRFFLSLAAESGESVPGSRLVPDGRFAGYFLIRRLHSLTGVIPLGIFLVQHFYINSISLQGEERYTGMATGLRGLPYLLAVEFFLILLPLYFHGLLGLFLCWRGQANVLRYPFARNWMYLFQRITGVVTIAFVTYHLLHTRFSGTEAEGLFQLMHRALADPLVLGIYLVGVTASSYHLANGLWGFFITWGIAQGRRVQAVASVAVHVLFVILVFFSVNALLGFSGRGLRLLH